MRSWTAAGQPTSAIPLVTAERIGCTPGSSTSARTTSSPPATCPAPTTSSSASLPAAPATSPAGPTVVMCGHGERAMSAASVLASAGHRDVAVLAGGPQDWAESTGQCLEVAS